MSNNLLPRTNQQVHAAAMSNNAPSGLRMARRSTLNSGHDSNPILRAKDQRLQRPMFNADALLLSPADKRLLELQNELVTVNAQQKQRQQEDDLIVEKHEQHLQSRMARIEAAKQGERVADFGTFIPHAKFNQPAYLLQLKAASTSTDAPPQPLHHPQPPPPKAAKPEIDATKVDRDLLMMDDDDDDDNNEDATRGKDGPTVAALRPNLYSEAARAREQRIAEAQEKKRKAEQEAKERQMREQKRRGALANLALKRQQNPELFENAHKVDVRKQYDLVDGAAAVATAAAVVAPPAEGEEKAL